MYAPTAIYFKNETQFNPALNKETTATAESGTFKEKTEDWSSAP
jgi:hypothetical protein